jgi:hypothetical protein
MPQSIISLMETTICRNSHNSSDWDSRRTRVLGCKHTFCQNFVCTKNYVCLYFRITCIFFGPLRIYQVFSVSRKINVGGLRHIAVLWAILTILANLLCILFVWWNYVWNCGPSGASVPSVGGRWMNVAFRGMIYDRGNRRGPSRRKPCSNGALCSINPTWTALGLKPVANHLYYGGVYYKRISVMQGSYPLKLSLLLALTLKEL